jgi:hypothetical protein
MPSKNYSFSLQQRDFVALLERKEEISGAASRPQTPTA